MDIPWLGALLLALVIIWLTCSAWNASYRKNKMPPGPRPLPIVGNLLQMRRGKMVTTFLEFREKYGPLYTVYLGSRPVIILCDYDTVKEALIDHSEVFAGRGELPSLDSFIKGYGIIFGNGESWKYLRRFSITMLRNFGMGKKTSEQRIQEEAVFVVAEIRSLKGKSIDPSIFLVQCVSNVICSVVFGERFEYNNQSFQKLLTLFQATFRDMSSTWGQLMDMLPNIMKYIPGPHKKIYNHLTNLTDFIYERVKMHQETLDPNSPRDFIDCFLIKQQQEKDNPSLDMQHMIITILNLFFAGSETVSTTLRHGFLLLVKYPEIQAKIHKEIDSVVGDNRKPNIEDRSKMPYTDAVIHEIQRFSDILPLNLPHLVTKDIIFRGYTIPKGMNIFPLLCTVLRDPKMFATPDKFNPNHFLDSNGCFKKNDGFMAFSAGKRVCAGEGLARMELFIFLTTTLQNFTLTSKTKFTDEDITPRMTGFANLPIPYEISFIPRFPTL